MLKSDRKDLFLIFLFSLGIVFLMAGGAILFYARSVSVLGEEVRERLRTNAALAAMQFAAADIEAIRGPEDRESALFRSLVERAEAIRSRIPDAAFLYVMRRTEDPKTLAFVIENDMLLPREAQDLNGNGVVDPDEAVPLPGDPYDIADVIALQEAAFQGPAADPEINRDQWGWWMSAYAPVTDADGKAVAIVGLDMRADRFRAATRRVLSPPLFFLLLFGFLLILGGFFGFLLRRRLRLLERLDLQRRAMVTVASHKLGGPIATLRWWIENVKTGVLQKETDLREAEEELSGAVERLSDVTKNLDEVTKVSAEDPAFMQRLARETAGEIASVKRS